VFLVFFLFLLSLSFCSFFFLLLPLSFAALSFFDPFSSFSPPFGSSSVFLLPGSPAFVLSAFSWFSLLFPFFFVVFFFSLRCPFFRPLVFRPSFLFLFLFFLLSWSFSSSFSSFFFFLPRCFGFLFIFLCPFVFVSSFLFLILFSYCSVIVLFFVSLPPCFCISLLLYFFFCISCVFLSHVFSSAVFPFFSFLSFVLLFFFFFFLFWRSILCFTFVMSFFVLLPFPLFAYLVCSVFLFSPRFFPVVSCNLVFFVCPFFFLAVASSFCFPVLVLSSFVFVFFFFFFFSPFGLAFVPLVFSFRSRGLFVAYSLCFYLFSYSPCSLVVSLFLCLFSFDFPLLFVFVFFVFLLCCLFFFFSFFSSVGLFSAFLRLFFFGGPLSVRVLLLLSFFFFFPFLSLFPLSAACSLCLFRRLSCFSLPASSLLPTIPSVFLSLFSLPLYCLFVFSFTRRFVIACLNLLMFSSSFLPYRALFSLCCFLFSFLVLTGLLLSFAPFFCLFAPLPLIVFFSHLFFRLLALRSVPLLSLLCFFFFLILLSLFVSVLRFFSVGFPPDCLPSSFPFSAFALPFIPPFLFFFARFAGSASYLSFCLFAVFHFGFLSVVLVPLSFRPFLVFFWFLYSCFPFFLSLWLVAVFSSFFVCFSDLFRLSLFCPRLCLCLFFVALLMLVLSLSFFSSRAFLLSSPFGACSLVFSFVFLSCFSLFRILLCSPPCLRLSCPSFCVFLLRFVFLLFVILFFVLRRLFLF